MVRAMAEAIGARLSLFRDSQASVQSSAHLDFGCLLVELALAGESDIALPARLHRIGSRMPIVFAVVEADLALRD